MKIQVNRDSLISLLPDIAQEISDGREYDLEVKPHKDKRSLSANDYMWVLCVRLAEKLGISKEDVYRKHIKDVGSCDFIAVPDKAYDAVVDAWGKRGIGWFCELVDGCKLPGCKKVCVYYGSSTYNTAEMSRLIDDVTAECKEQGIETEPQDKIDDLLRRWTE